MRGFFYILLIILVVLYILSPFDLIPDLLPIYGWIDDTFLLGLLIYFLRRGRLPGFLINLKSILDPFKKKNAKYRHSQTDSSGSSDSSGSWLTPNWCALVARCSRHSADPCVPPDVPRMSPGVPPIPSGATRY